MRIVSSSAALHSLRSEPLRPLAIPVAIPCETPATTAGVSVDAAPLPLRDGGSLNATNAAPPAPPRGSTSDMARAGAGRPFAPRAGPAGLNEGDDVIGMSSAPVGRAPTAQAGGGRQSSYDGSTPSERPAPG